MSVLVPCGVQVRKAGAREEDSWCRGVGLILDVLQGTGIKSIVIGKFHAPYVSLYYY